MTETLNYEPHAICHATLTAVRNKINKRQTAQDACVLAVHTPTEDHFNQYRDIVQGADHCMSIVGTSAVFAAVEELAESTKQAYEAAEPGLQEKIDKSRAETQRYESELRKLRDAKTAAAADLAKRQAKRKLLMTTLLPPLMKELVAIEERPVHQKFKPLLAEARQRVAMAASRSRAGMDDSSVVAWQDAESELKALEAEYEAALMAVGGEYRNFYLND